jgi:sugar-specific transcriptional regulator TrmB
VAPWPPEGLDDHGNEAKLLGIAAVRVLGRPTAREVAGHTGLPNGSVAVALRALGTRGLVARTESGRGIEYTLPPGAAWA